MATKTATATSTSRSTSTSVAGAPGPPARRCRVHVRATVLAVSLVLLSAALAACGGGGHQASTAPSSTTGAVTDPTADAASGTTAPTTPAGLGGGFAPARRGRRALRGFGEAAATITSGSGATCEVCLLVASSEAQRERGLMGVTDPALGGYDGMLFRYAVDTAGSFWMRNTPTPLSIAYFDRSGRLVSTSDMAPCGDSPDCPTYPATAPFRSALEVPKGMLDDLGVTGPARIELRPGDCPLRRPA